jgi:putative hemolysin
MSRCHDGRRIALGASATLVLSALLVPPAMADTQPDMQAARDYCTSAGGEVQERAATWGTNNDQSQWLDLDRSIEVCRFQADDEAQSRIYVDLWTLYSEQPSLAAAAYVAKTPMSEELPPGNPATYHCASLNGSSMYGLGAAGGGWVNLDDPIDIVVGMCVFPDGSMIDEWGIAYYSAGEVRGADLAPLFRSDPGTYPPIFG